MTTQERFAEDWGMPVGRVEQLVGLARECAQLGEHVCNGARHPRNKLHPEDKNKNAQLWGNAQDVATAELLRLAESYGFTDVIYAGLGPTLKRGEQFVEIPY